MHITAQANSASSVPAVASVLQNAEATDKNSSGEPNLIRVTSAYVSQPQTPDARAATPTAATNSSSLIQQMWELCILRNLSLFNSFLAHQVNFFVNNVQSRTRHRST